MNRIKISPLASASPIQEEKIPPKRKIPASVFSPETFEPGTTQEIACFAPINYEKNYAYPLIIWLHSDGQSSRQLETLMPSLSIQNYVGVAPHASVGNFQCGYFWEQDWDSIQSAHDLISESISRAKAKFNINPKRIFLAGAGGGGTMALRVGLQRPDEFAGIVSMNGPMPSGLTPLSQWTECRQMPIFWSHALDAEDRGTAMCEQFRFLYASGFLNVTAREYPTLGYLQKLAPQAVNEWIMEQISSSIC